VDGLIEWMQKTQVNSLEISKKGKKLEPRKAAKENGNPNLL
tara:strand:- start:272 stop:394 length:123 start_codon:yes stop_codon:yes gene_type:complete